MLSSFQKRTFVEAGVEQEKLVITPYGVDLELFRPGTNRENEDTFRVIFAGQITQRTNYSRALAEGEGASEYDGRSEAAAEIAALWAAIEKSVQAINGAYQGRVMHKVAA